MSKEFRICLLVISALVSIYFSKKTARLRPPTDALVDVSFLTKFLVWYWPFGDQWKSKLKPNFHQMYLEFRKSSMFTWAAIIVMATIAIYNELCRID